MKNLPPITPGMQWEPLIDYEEYYAISEYAHIVTLKKRKSIPAGKYLVPKPDKYGYLRYTLCVDGAKRGHAISHLVYRTFVGEIPPGCELDHKDSNKSNNHYTNLEPMTHVKNIEKARKENRFRPVRGVNSKLAKLDDDKVREARLHYMSKTETIASMAARWGCTSVALTNAIHGVTWQHIPMEPGSIFVEQIRRGELDELDEEMLIAVLESGVNERFIWSHYRGVTQEIIDRAKEQVRLLRESML